MSDILEEVLNDRNEEKRLVFFKKLLPIVVIFSIIIVIIMIINNNYQNKKTKNNQNTGDIFVKAINIESVKGNKVLAYEALENLSNNSDNKMKEIALLEQVAIKISEKKYQDAKNLLEQIIQNDQYQEITAAYARISWLSLVIDDQEFANANKDKIISYLKYFDNEEKVFWATANILKAIWDIKNNDITSAKESLKILLTSKNASELTKDQAKALLTNVNNKAI